MSDKTLREAAERATRIFYRMELSVPYKFLKCMETLRAALANSADAPEGPQGTWWCHSAEGGVTLHHEEGGGSSDGVYLPAQDFPPSIVDRLLVALNATADAPEGPLWERLTDDDIEAIAQNASDAGAMAKTGTLEAYAAGFRVALSNALNRLDAQQKP